MSGTVLRTPIIALLTAAFPIWCMAGSNVSTPAAGDGGALIKTLEGATHSSDMLTFTANGITANNTKTQFRELINISFANRKARPAPSLVILSNGDQIAMQVRTITEESVSGIRPGGTAMSIPLEFVKAIGRNLPETTVARTNRLRQVDSSSPDDTVFLTNGDRVIGEIQGLTEKGLSIESAGGLRTLPIASIATIRFSSELISPIPSNKALAILQTTSEDIITIAGVNNASENQLKSQTVWGAEFVVPTTQVVQLQFLHDRLTYLSDLPPRSVKHVPVIGKPRNWQPDRTVNVTPFRHSGRHYPKGVGTTSRMELTWNLGGAYMLFNTQYGLDDTAPKGAAVFEVHLDGQQVFNSGTIRDTKLRQLPVLNVAGARELKLTVDYGPRGDLQDTANWVGAALTKRMSK